MGSDETSGAAARLICLEEPEQGVATLKAVKFLFTAPLILLMLIVINLMTSPGHWWVQWAALGLGIAWFWSLPKVIPRGHRGRGLAAVGT